MKRTSFTSGVLELPKLDTTGQIVHLIRVIYDYNLAGGNCHIVLDDYNIEETHILWVLKKAIPENIHKAESAQLEAEKKCMTLMLQIPEEDRENLIRQAFGRGE